MGPRYRKRGEIVRVTLSPGYRLPVVAPSESQRNTSSGKQPPTFSPNSCSEAAAKGRLRVILRVTSEREVVRPNEIGTAYRTPSEPLHAFQPR